MMHQGMNVTYKQYRNKTRMDYIWQFVGFGVVFFGALIMWALIIIA